MSFTASQLGAIEQRGNTLVIAAAGAGKTGTLVEKVKRLLLQDKPRVSIRNILVVTFTEAAAAEVRERLRLELERHLHESSEDDWLQEQLANLDAASISTLHSFCFDLIRKHLLELELDPSVSILEPADARLLFLDTIDLLINEHLAGLYPFSGELKELIRAHFGGWDKPLRDFIEQLHEFTQTRPDPAGWFQREIAHLSRETCPEWHTWHRDAIRAWCTGWIPFLETLPEENTNAHTCLRLLKEACATDDIGVAAAILARDNTECWPKGKKTKHRAAFEKLFSEAEFLSSLEACADGPHPLDQDWEWMRTPLLLLLRFGQQFAERFASEKLSRGALDFHDLEQHALRVLLDPATREPSTAAREWQARFEAIFVDEYQDINAAQDLIISALSRPAPGNRFLVGDMKQSIYRFRQADPSIFKSYAVQAGGKWAEFSLSENFRSHETILRFVNPIFSWLMKPEFGGLEYNEEAQLRFGAPESRQELAHAPEIPRVEVHLLLDETNKDRIPGEENEDEVDNAEAEATALALHLLELKEGGFTIYHQKEKRERPVEWRDMVVLLRAAKNKLDVFVKAFAAAGVPLQARRNAFFTTQEVLDLCNVLTILDNPIQDIPLVAVLHSPIAGLTAGDLALVRAEIRTGSFWSALNGFLEKKTETAAQAKIERFLRLFHAWRNPRDCSSLHQRLERILTDTGYADWLLTQPRGRERYANIQQLLRIARRFDESRGESLYLFVRHLEELQDAVGDIEPASVTSENAVRIMTVHQSKGLEFPVVAVADLGKRFNSSASSESIFISDDFGVCSMIKPPDANSRYPSLPLWLARRKEKLESIGEEMRVLYVALTRAQNHLLLFGSAKSSAPARWSDLSVPNPLPQQMLKTGSWLDWIAASTCQQFGTWWNWPRFQDDGVVFITHREKIILEKKKSPPAVLVESAQIQLLRSRWQTPYPYTRATQHPAKTSVTRLRKEAFGEEAVPLRTRSSGPQGAERGVATHTFLEHLPLNGSFQEAELRATAAALAERSLLAPEQIPAIDFEGVQAFWNSDVGRELLSHRALIRREFPFTSRLTALEIKKAGIENVMIPEGEFVVVQGIADLVLLDEKEISLIDFKTDSIESSGLNAAKEQYRPQLALYSLALESIFNRPVKRRGIYFLALKQMVWL